MTTSATDEFLVRAGRFFTQGEVSADLRTVTKHGGREGDVFYRDRWSHDKVVRSHARRELHRARARGRCTSRTGSSPGRPSRPTTRRSGPDSPEYEPRGCPRGAAFSWYTYSPTRVRYPYVRGVLLEAYRAAKAANGDDPVKAWAAVVDDPETRRRYQRARGKGGLVRASWAEVDRDDRRRPRAHDQGARPGPGLRVLPDPGDVDGLARRRRALRQPHRRGDAQSFYDWYADLPVASPQVFGDQTDVPESADWWNASYLIMWGANVPHDPHPGRALHGRGPLPRPEGRDRLARTTPTTRSSPTSG